MKENSFKSVTSAYNLKKLKKRTNEIQSQQKTGNKVIMNQSKGKQNQQRKTVKPKADF